MEETKQRNESLAHSAYRNLENVLSQRELYGPSKFKKSHFESEVKSNRSFVYRMELSKTLRGHKGCVNGIRWSNDAKLLVTGSDDCKINVYEPENDYKMLVSLNTAHVRNIFDVVVIPDGTNSKILSCGMDGQVAMTNIVTKSSQNVAAANSVALAGFNHMVNKIHFLYESATTFLTTHQDGLIRKWDLREKPSDVVNNVLLNLNPYSESPNAGNSLSISKSDPNRFVVSADHHVRLYDIRYVNKSTTTCIRQYAPANVHTAGREAPYITGLDFNECNEVVATYSRSDVYLFDLSDNHSTSNDTIYDYKMVYKGRRNEETFLKEVVFFGANSFVATGSDCGHMFIWDKNTGSLVQLLKADHHVVNGIAPHPFYPTLATCGIDSEAKVFELGDKNTFSLKYAKSVVDKNLNNSTSKDSMNLNDIWKTLSGRPEETGTSRWRVRGGEFLNDTEASAKIAESEAKKNFANELFKSSKYQEAIQAYDEAIRLVEFERSSEDEIREKQIQAKVTCMLNKAACNLKLGRNEQVKADCSLVLAIQPDNVKALVRRGTACINTNDLDAAMEDLKKASTLAPEDPLIKKLIQDIKTKQQNYKEREKRAFQKMFQ